MQLSRALINATVTPLASIFGSGFLIIVPILAGVVGIYSVAAMAVVCLLAILVGSVIRYNIKHAEPLLNDGSGEHGLTLGFERTADLALILAYVISVCLYLHILSAFVLAGLGLDSLFREDLLTTAVILAITVMGVLKGLQSLELLERWALLCTLIIIVLLVFGFAAYDLRSGLGGQGFQWPVTKPQTAWQVLTVLAGTLIVVQGFETTRYLGSEFDARTRILASRWSQLISTAIYLTFIALALPLVHLLGGSYDDNSLILLAGYASALLVAPLIIAAALSQFSAAVADTLAATGIMAEATHGALKARVGYLLVGVGAIVLTWSADTFELVSLASRAFAFYYLLQCLVALSVCKNHWQQLGMLMIALILVFITLFAVPAA